MLDKPFKMFLRGKAHHLQPLLMVGKGGLSDAVSKKLEHSLMHHELVKIKIQGADKNEVKEIVESLKVEKKLEIIQTVGFTATVYRQNDEAVLHSEFKNPSKDFD